MSGDKSISDLLHEGKSLFERYKVHHGHGLYDAWDEAVYLLSHALNLSLDADRSILNKMLSDEEVFSVRRLFEERARKRKPAAYLTSCAYFCGLSFYVDRRVLIPRSPIGQLITEKFKPWIQVPPTCILDLCTGSGCIGISCAHVFPNARVTLSDISEQALKVARKNVRHHKLSKRIKIVQSDFFSDLPEETYDLIVSNPPYVDAEDYLDMPPEYSHEPRVGLVSGPDGLDSVRRLLSASANYLNEKGILVVEVGNSAQALEECFSNVPFIWVDFLEGDGGVFVLTREELLEYRQFFS